MSVIQNETISKHKECTDHNEKYNDKFYTQVTLNNNTYGEKKLNHKYSFTAYVADRKVDAVKQIIYVISELYKQIKLLYNIESPVFNLVIDLSPETILIFNQFPSHPLILPHFQPWSGKTSYICDGA